jgi:membrane protease YdiL (CAAX protease family)
MRQGVAGMVMSTIMGLLWGFFYFFTGSIFFPILIHAFSDLRLLLIGPIESENVAAQSEEKPSAVLS